MNILSSIGGKILSIIKNTGILLTWLAGIILIMSAYCGYIDPEHTAKFAIIGMIFPIALTINIVILILWAVFRKWMCVLLEIIFMAICFTPIITFSPINIPTNTATPADSTFRVLTYNVMNFDDLDSLKHQGENRTLRYILDQNADIVILQEASAKIKMNKLEKIRSLMPELKEKYPYREQRLRDLVILSKHPYQIHNDHITSNEPYKSVAYKIDINGRTLYVIDVHLESIRLTESDKALYRDITDIHKSTDNLNEKTVNEVKSNLLSKLATAFRKRAVQAEDLKNYINSLGTANVILCGDFNDTPSSYSYRTIKGDDMNDAYKDCGLGPMITFHTNRFYFRIDHVLYKGDFEAVDIKRGDLKSSDHYPLLTTFKWK